MNLTRPYKQHAEAELLLLWHRAVEAGLKDTPRARLIRAELDLRYHEKHD